MNKKLLYLVVYFAIDILFILLAVIAWNFEGYIEQYENLFSFGFLALGLIWYIIFHYVYIFKVLKSTEEGFEPWPFLTIGISGGKFKWALKNRYYTAIIPIFHIFAFPDYNRRVNEMIEKEASQSS